MYAKDFTAVRTWIFDLDNTLYPPSAQLFDQMDIKMTAFIMDALGVEAAEALHLQKTYWREHGTTLAGLITRHNMAPEAFLEAVHDIDLSGLSEDPQLASRIAALPGRKLVYTNGSRTHAERVTAARGLSGAFDALFGIEDAQYLPKPHPDAYARILSIAAADPTTAAMFEDDPRNLEAPYAMGMRTVLIGAAEDAEHIHHQSEDLSDFLSRLL